MEVVIYGDSLLDRLLDKGWSLLGAKAAAWLAGGIFWGSLGSLRNSLGLLLPLSSPLPGGVVLRRSWRNDLWRREGGRIEGCGTLTLAVQPPGDLPLCSASPGSSDNFPLSKL